MMIRDLRMKTVEEDDNTGKTSGKNFTVVAVDDKPKKTVNMFDIAMRNISEQKMNLKMTTSRHGRGGRQRE